MNLGWGILLLFCSHIGLFDLLICLHPGEFASFVKKKKMLMSWIDLTDLGKMTEAKTLNMKSSDFT